MFSILNGIEDWDDFENRFLYGAGLSENTYRNSKSAIKQFFDWTKTLPENKSDMMRHPAEITLRHIERFFDFQTNKNSVQTAVIRNGQLRQFFKKLGEEFPFLASPYEKMNDALKRKLRGPGKADTSMNILTRDELERIYVWLQEKE